MVDGSFVPATLAEPRLVGYARVSTDDQDLSLQIDALTKHGIPKSYIFMNKLSECPCLQVRLTHVHSCGHLGLPLRCRDEITHPQKDGTSREPHSWHESPTDWSVAILAV